METRIDVKNECAKVKFYKELKRNIQMKKFILLQSLVVIFTVSFYVHAFAAGPEYDIIYTGIEKNTADLDTIPLQERYDNFVTNSTYNPFDLNDPSEVKQEVTYDPETGLYKITERIGDDFFRAPTYMTFNEYLDWRAKEQEKDYFNQLAGIESSNRSKSGIIDPLAKIDIKKKLVDRLFGGNQITLEPQGNVDLTFGFDHQRVENPNIPLRAQSFGGFDFQMNIKTNIQGKIGDKMDLGFNFDSNSTFNFDNKIKLEYDSEKWTEDDILKKIELGDVSLPLRSQLIQGNQSLFGVKTELQFGHLKLTAIAAEQQSQKNELSIESGGTLQEFEVYPDEYDENRHFFLSHFNRNTYEDNTENLPFITTPFRIINMQVWVTNDRQESENLRDIAAIADLGVGEEEYLTNPGVTLEPVNQVYRDFTGEHVLNDNNRNSLYEVISDDDQTRKIQNTATNLQSKYGLVQSKDFEVLKARRLTSNEYTFHEELGFLSLNVRLQTNQVLAVSYQYTYTYNGDEIYQVGELADEISTQDSSEVIYTKLLKSSVQNVSEPNWDLMMKNVYPVGAAQVDPETFKFDIYFEDNTDGTLKRYIPSNDKLAELPLLNVFQLDNLNIQGDPQPDGIFDFVPGVTIIPRTGAIIFPVLEPFGSSLVDLITDPDLEIPNAQAIADSLSYQSLYDNTIIVAREQLNKNRFTMRGEYKSPYSSEISLGAFNIPRGSVTVRSGGQQLIEGQDYEIDYGIGRLKILNNKYLNGVPIKVSFENNSFFNLQRKYMLGARADYAVSKNFNIGATYMHLFERPYTEKVNIGEDPISNRIFGFDMNYNNELPWLTRALDKLPFYSTSTPSSINSEFEIAYLKPGHSSAINNTGEEGGVIMVDDFEGSSSGIPLGNFNLNEWVIASTPVEAGFEEATRTNDLSNGYNRALVNWYLLESHYLNASDENNPYTRLVDRLELFPNITQLQSQLPNLNTFDISYYPDKRGPYNFDPPNGSDVSAGSFYDSDDEIMRLNAPETRWGGIMRYLDNNDFQQLNVEYIEFWMLNPFIDTDERPQMEGETGELHFNLGNVSEDILKDNLQFYENGLTFDQDDPLPVQMSNWGDVPLLQPKTIQFDLQNAQDQDLGLDGLGDAAENDRFQGYVTQVLAQFPNANIKLDPANDNYATFDNDSAWSFNNQSALERLRLFNNSQGNVPEPNGTQFARGKTDPDIEDLNENRSLDQGENYYDYTIKLRNKNGEIDMDETDYIREFIDLGANGEERWYRFQIPINDPDSTIGTIEGFRSIQFLRMYMKGFSNAKTFRLADFELVRNQWRRLETACSDGPNPVEFAIDAVSIEENAQKTPFNYVLPPGIQRQRVLVNNQNVLQNEKSLALQFCGLPTTNIDSPTVPRDCEPTVYKLTRLDMRLYDRLQLFFHGESVNNYEKGDLKVFIRIGRDFTENFYEYEIPLEMSDPSLDIGDQDNVWPADNKIDVLLQNLPDLKLERNANNYPSKQLYTKADPDDPENLMSIIGNPTLGYIKGMQIGVRNYTETAACGEVWVNELRLVGLEERGGVASIARADVAMADLGTVALTGAYSSVGFGSLDQKLADRSQEEVVEYAISTAIDVNKLLPGDLPINLPLVAQYSSVVKTPKYDPYDLDITVKDKVDANPDEASEIRERALDKTTISTINMTNVRINQKNKKKSKPWDISNVSTSYSFTRQNHSDPIIAQDVTDNHIGSLDYAYSRSVKYWEPFKKVKNKNLGIVKAVNFNFFPNAFGVKNELKRYKNTRTYRLPEEFDYTFYDQRFNWNRRYNLQWDFTKALNFSFNANNQSVIDELRIVGVGGFQEVVDERGQRVGDVDDITKRERQDYLYGNLREGGRAKDYTHNFTLQYTLPTRSIKALNWTSVRASYSGDYIWDGASLNVDSLGNVISNAQSRQLTATFNFDKLYAKSKYLDKIENGNKKKTRRNSRRQTSKSRTDNGKTGSKDPKKDDKEKKERDVTKIERILIRPLLALRTVKFTYRENFGTVVPGIVRNSRYLGLDQNFEAPGWEFVGGLQPNIDPTNSNNWLYRGAERDWFTTSRFLNQQVLQTHTQNLELKVDFELFKDFDIELNMKKNFSLNHSEEFKFLDNEYQQLILRDMGTFEVSYFALNTLWNDDYNGLFTEFENNRQSISQRLQNRAAQEANDLGIPFTPGEHEDDIGYAKGYGRQSTDVLIPAFLATYTGESVDAVDLSIGDRIQQLNYIPAPNWTLNYNGLTKLKWFKDIFSTMSLKHGYKSTLQVSSFNSDADYNPLNPYEETQLQSNNYYTKFDVPQITISEEFAPLIGIDIRTKKALNFNTEYRKSRILALDFYAKELVETQSEEFSIGAGYVFEDVNIPFLTRRKSTKKSKKKKADPNAKNNNKSSGGLGKVTNTKGNNLTLNCDFSFRDDVVWNHTIDISGGAQATRGIKSWRANPSVEYDVNDNVALRLFFDYSKSVPATTNSYPITNMQGGLTVRLKLAEL